MEAEILVHVVTTLAPSIPAPAIGLGSIFWELWKAYNGGG
mgnify:CR=1 FL=1